MGTILVWLWLKEQIIMVDVSLRMALVGLDERTDAYNTRSFQ